MNTWWFDAFPLLPYTTHPPGSRHMLTLIGYDIAHPRRLARVARACEDYGLRVQYSFFECHLTQEDFQALWQRLLDEIDPDEDRLVAYKLDARAAREIETAGTMVCSERVICYLV